MALTQSYVGTNTIGASSRTPSVNVAYVKSVSIPAGSVLSAVEAYFRFTDGNRVGFRVGLWADNAGAPGTLLLLTQPKADNLVVGGQDRWYGRAVGRHFAATTTVWIGVQLFDPASTTLAYETTGGTDRTITTGGIWTGEAGAAGTTVSSATTSDYSIRGLVVA